MSLSERSYSLFLFLSPAQGKPPPPWLVLISETKCEGFDCFPSSAPRCILGSKSKFGYSLPASLSSTYQYFLSPSCTDIKFYFTHTSYWKILKFSVLILKMGKLRLRKVTYPGSHTWAWQTRDKNSCPLHHNARLSYFHWNVSVLWVFSREFWNPQSHSLQQSWPHSMLKYAQICWLPFL